MSINNKKLMDEVHAAMRLGHYSIHTERPYGEWIRRFVDFHGMKTRKDLRVKGPHLFHLTPRHTAGKQPPRRIQG